MTSTTDVMTDGERCYTASVKARPCYTDGTPRRSWPELSEANREAWERLAAHLLTACEGSVQ